MSFKWWKKQKQIKWIMTKGVRRECDIGCQERPLWWGNFEQSWVKWVRQVVSDRNQEQQVQKPQGQCVSGSPWGNSKNASVVAAQ